MNKWSFLSNEAEEEEGLADAGIETFRGSPYSGIARECSQNSLDAASKVEGAEAEQVHLIFRLQNVAIDEIPDAAGLSAAFAACLAQAEGRASADEIKFFKDGLDLLRSNSIPVLTIEDYGTTGLHGPDRPGTPFSALVKSSGISQKPDDAGGSFGIGKSAVYAVSSLRTVFYSTLYQPTDSSEQNFLAQGKSILISHLDKENRAKRATGYWGAGHHAISDLSAVPQWLFRDKIGTTVASVGFIAPSDWQWQIAESLVRNFFAAISEGTIRFSVIAPNVDAIEINASTLKEVFSLPPLKSAAASVGSEEDLAFSEAMMEALVSADARVMRCDVPRAGAFQLRLLERKGFPKRVGILRNGMYIANNLGHFGHPLSRFNLSRDFVAVLEPSDGETRRRIRRMENPKHDEISAERLGLTERDQVRSAMRRVGNWVREMIKGATTEAATNEILLQEMNEFFRRSGSGDGIADSGTGDSDPEKTRLTARSVKVTPVGSGESGGSGSAGGRRDGKGGGGRTTGDRMGQGRGSNGGRGGRSLSYSGLRNVVPDRHNPNVHQISFTPNASGEASIELAVVGVSRDEPLSVRSIDGMACAKSPTMDFTEGHRVSFCIAFEEPYDGPLSLVLAQKEEPADAH